MSENRFDGFTRQELVLLSVGLAASAMLTVDAAFVDEEVTPEQRRSSAQVCLDTISLMEELGQAGAWSEEAKNEIGRKFDPDLIDKLKAVADGSES